MSASGVAIGSALADLDVYEPASHSIHEATNELILLGPGVDRAHEMRGQGSASRG